MTELRGLPVIAPGEAHLRRIVTAALSGRRVGGATMLARFVPVEDGHRGWFACEHDLFVAIERLNGTDRRASVDDGVAAAELIEAAEPLLDAIEVGLNLAIEPSALASDHPGGHVVATVTTLRRGATIDRLLLALPADIELFPASPPPAAPELLATVRLRAGVTIPGPRVAPHDAADLARGDLLLLGAGPLRAELSVGDARSFAGHFDPARRCFEIGQID